MIFTNGQDALSREIEGFILANVEESPRTITRITMQKYRLTRPAVLGHVNRLVREGKLIAKGSTKDRAYAPAVLVDIVEHFPISPQSMDDTVWTATISPRLAGLPENVIRICAYGFTEMVNNALEHSEGKTVTVGLRLTAATVRLAIIDDGVGIFSKIARDLRLDEPREAILELSKGKLTTDPDHHTGEGVFFTARMFDNFSIISDGLFFSHAQPSNDWLVESDRRVPGTTVVLELSVVSDRTSQGVFDVYADAEHGFSRTHVPVTLARYGDEGLVSRSQAKRLLARFNRFSEGALDFKGVTSIGQAFADEVFRVFPKQNPGVDLTPLNTNDDVRAMILRVMSSSVTTQEG